MQPLQHQYEQHHGMLSSRGTDQSQLPPVRRVSAGGVLQRHSGGGLPPPVPGHRLPAASGSSPPRRLRQALSHQSFEPQHWQQAGRPIRSSSALQGMSPIADSQPLPASVFNILPHRQDQPQPQMGCYSSQPNMRHVASQHFNSMSPPQHDRQQQQRRQQLQPSASHHHFQSAASHHIQPAAFHQEVLDHQVSIWLALTRLYPRPERYPS